jgi:hypothetical protein
MTHPDSPTIRLSTERMFDGKVFEIDRDRVQMPNGREVTVDIVRHNRSVVLLPMPDPMAVGAACG